MDPWLLSVVVAALAVVLVVLLRYRGQRTATTAKRRGPPTHATEAVPVAGGRRRAGPRLRRTAPRADEVEPAEGPELAAEAELDDEDDAAAPEAKLGKKKLEKLQLKADKKAAREAEEREREERKKRLEASEEAESQAREVEQAALKEAEEAEEQRRAALERAELEAYEKLKSAFSVEEEGFDEDEAGDDEENRLQTFVQYIRDTKVVVLEDLAAHFKMTTPDAIDRVNRLQEDGQLTGVIDDRGKFIYICQTELEAVAKFIRQRGRVSIADLAESSNQLVNLTPETTHVQG